MADAVGRRQGRVFVTKLYVDNDRFGSRPATVIVEAFHGLIRDMVRRKWQESGVSWSDFVFGSSNDLIATDDFSEIDRQILSTGHRFGWTAVASINERPDAYKPAAGGATESPDFSFEHPDAIIAAADSEGREQRGQGDNVVRSSKNTRGIARYIRSSEKVLEYMSKGVPPDTIAIIDDSGGTLTAPILEQFKGVVCAGGTVRAHLGILTREYGIPCFMNAKISGIHEGDQIEMESTAVARTADSYQTGVEMTGRIWLVR